MTEHKRLVTLKDIAERANLSIASVSMAMRDKPSLSKATIARVKQIAAELGYVPDPALSALAARRGGGRVTASVIAIVSNWSKRSGWLGDHGSDEIFEGAKARAKELGYDLQHFWAKEDRMSGARFSEILEARGIRGVIVARLESVDDVLDLDWDKFSLVSLENPNNFPHIHNVAQDQYAAATLCWKQLLKKGYTRIGLVVDTTYSARWGNRWVAAHALYQSTHVAPGDSVPVLQVSGQGQVGAIRDWLRANRPQVVISRAECFLEAAAAEGLRVPEDIGYVSLNVLDDAPDATGIYQHRDEMGSSAVDVLNSLLQSYQRGMNDIRRGTYIAGSWQEGNTLLPKPPR